MKIRVERADLTEAVAWTARTLPTRATVPVLSGLLLQALDGSSGSLADGPVAGGSGAEGTGREGLRLSGSDFEVAAHAQVPVTVLEPGRALVSGRLLAEICRSLPQAPVEMTGDGTRVTLTCGSARFTLPTMPVEDYPPLPAMPPVAGQVAAATFATAVNQVAIAAGRDDTLPVLTGVRLEIDGERLTLAATDRYRLAVRELAWQPEGDTASAVALVRARTLAETARALAGSGRVSLALGSGAQGEALAGLAGGDRRTTTRLLEGEFPNYRALLPSSFEATADVDAALLTEAVKRVALVGTTRTAPVRLTLTPAAAGEQGELLLEAGSGDDPQASESLAATFSGDPITIAFNPGYLLDGLGQLEGSMARLSMTGATRPAILSALDPAGTGDQVGTPDYRYLLMPVRLPG